MFKPSRIHCNVHLGAVERSDSSSIHGRSQSCVAGSLQRWNGLGLAVVSMSLLGISGLYLLFTTVFGKSPDIAPSLIVGFAFGASFAALFAQLGGGIYTKAADVSADLVGKVEEGIPEDDPRNPAVVADLVGDNVGDIAGRGADLFESITGENIGAMILCA